MEKGQSLSEFAQTVKRLTRQAYPDANPELQETLVLDQFIDSLIDSEIRIRWRECCLKTMNELHIYATNKVDQSISVTFVEKYTDEMTIHTNVVRTKSSLVCNETTGTKGEVSSSHLPEIKQCKLQSLSPQTKKRKTSQHMHFTTCKGHVRSSDY